MKSKLNLILQIATMVLLAVIIGLQVINFSNDESDNYIEKKLSEQKQWNDYQKEVGKKNIVVTDSKISRGDHSTYIIGDVNNTSDKTVSGVSIYMTLYKDNKPVDTSYEYIGDMLPNSTKQMEDAIYSVDFDTYTIDYVTGTIYD